VTLLRLLWWWATRREYWLAHVDGWLREYRTRDEALFAAVAQARLGGPGVAVSRAFWWDDPVERPRWVFSGVYEAHEVLEWARGLRSLPDPG
jgi:hypothetical protein